LHNSDLLHHIDQAFSPVMVLRDAGDGKPELVVEQIEDPSRWRRAGASG
jgi:hypothetical protein